MDGERFRIVGPEGVIEENLLWEDAFALKIERRYDDGYTVQAMTAAAPSTPPRVVSADAYRVRSGPGKVIGPLPRAMVVDLIVGGRVEESATVAPGESEGWITLTEVPQFNAALHERTALGLRAGWVKPRWSRPLDATGLAPLILELAHERSSGWLRVEGPDGARAGVITFAQGRVVHARSDNRRTKIGTFLVDDGLCTEAEIQRAVGVAKEVGVPVGVVLIDLGIVSATDIEVALVKQADLRLRELFAMTAGTARFEENLAAEGEDAVFDTPPVQLVRDLYLRAGALFIDVALRDLTRGGVEVAARDPRWWTVVESDLSDIEMVLLSDLGRAGPIGPALLAAQDHAEELDVAIGALLLVAGKCVATRRKGMAPELAALEVLLNNDNPWTALDVGEDASKIQLQLALERLRGQVKLVSDAEPVAQERMLARCDAIERQLTDPVEHHVFQAAAKLGLDPRDASVKRTLRIDYHRAGVASALAAGESAAARGHVDAWRALEPKAPLSVAAQARVFLRFGDDDERRQGLSGLIALAKRFPDEPEIQIAFAEAALDVGQRDLARQQIGRALAAGASPASIAALDARLEAT